jgi:putative salt-induced outer membrane protein
MKALKQASAAILLFGLTALPTLAHAEIPGPVEAMIKSAAATGDEAQLKAVVKAAKATNPGIGEEIEALAKKELAAAQTKAAAERQARLSSQGYFDGWDGEGQLGFGMSRGNTHETTGTLGLKLQKESLRFRHTITALADYGRTDGTTTREKFNAAYALNYKFNGHMYIYGSGMWERDKFAGYSRRFTESLGIGYTAIDTPKMSLDLEAGPSLRQINYIDNTHENQLAGRASLSYQWKITDTLTFNQDASALVASGDKTLVSTTAFTSKLLGALSARLSFNVQHETNPPLGLKNTDTSTRLTAVYDF